MRRSLALAAVTLVSAFGMTACTHYEAPVGAAPSAPSPGASPSLSPPRAASSDGSERSFAISARLDVSDALTAKAGQQYDITKTYDGDAGGGRLQSHLWLTSTGALISAAYAPPKTDNFDVETSQSQVRLLGASGTTVLSCARPVPRGRRSKPTPMTTQWRGSKPRAPTWTTKTGAFTPISSQPGRPSSSATQLRSAIPPTCRRHQDRPLCRWARRWCTGVPRTRPRERNRSARKSWAPNLTDDRRSAPW